MLDHCLEGSVLGTSAVCWQKSTAVVAPSIGADPLVTVGLWDWFQEVLWASGEQASDLVLHQEFCASCPTFAPRFAVIEVQGWVY